jgi:hypothetical protein
MRAAAERRVTAIATAIASLPAADRRRLVAAAGLLDQVATAVRDAPDRGADGG